MISYGGPFISSYRNELESGWARDIQKLQIMINPESKLIKTLGDAVKIRQWNIYQLPNDSLSIENGIIFDYAKRWTLNIDPQYQASKFLKNMGKDIESGFDIIKPSTPN